jgi:acetyl-CoA carboxylase biotin carboxyl carrier protein
VLTQEIAMALSYKDVADIVKIIDASSCDEFIVELGDTKIVLRRGAHGTESTTASPTPRPVQQLLPQSRSNSAPSAAIPANQEGRGNADNSTGVMRSPMVGTFYRAPSPKDPPFVDIGSVVKVGDPLCVIEVMKLFTTIEADRAGRVSAVYVSNAELVEFNQPLFRIE